MPPAPYERWFLPSVVTLIAGLSVLVGVIGADARWLAALGHDVASGGHIPSGLPFAGAPTGHWHNVTVLAELVFWELEALLGDRGLLLAQALAVGIAFGTLGWDALRGGGDRQRAASACLLAALGAAASLAIIRVQLFSLALFPVLLALLRSDARAPSRRLWLVVPLLAVWSNLHGGVLVGLGATLTYLILARLRKSPAQTSLLALLCVGALCANPAGVHALSYYHGVLSNAAAQRGEGMWGPLSPASPLDDLTILCVVSLALRARRARLAGWEIAVLVLLTAMTIHAARSGVWLLFTLVGPSAAGARPGARWGSRVVLLTAASSAAFAVAAVRGPTPNGVDPRFLARAIVLAHGTPVLADDIPSEQIALAGGRVWASDPIDALPRPVQVAYLDWMDGEPGGLAALNGSVHVALVSLASGEAALMDRAPGFRLVARERGFELFEREARSPVPGRPL